MLELRLYHTKKSIEQELEKDDLDGLSSPGVQASMTSQSNSNNNNNNNTNKAMFDSEHLRRENEQLRKQLRDEKEQTKQFSLNERQFFEAKLKEHDNELHEMEKQNAILKRKYQKLSEEMQDMQRMLDENKARNRELEKTQSKYDSDMNSLRSKLEMERDLREKCEHERDQAKYEIFTLKSDLETLKLENSYHIEKVERLERDLKEYECISMNSSSSISGVSGGGSTNTTPAAAQLLKTKAQLRDLETKLKDQEEELDEQSCTIQQLEQAKLRLEMQLEKEKQKWQRELAEKESEMDDLRFHTQKKIKSIEMQLEEEGELSNSLQREKRELERKLREFTQNSHLKHHHSNDLMLNANGLEYLSKLKRQMLKYKTLAIDAQTQLEKLRENLPKQSIMKSLKSQLEDSEIAKANALKSKHLLQVEVENLQQQLYEANQHKQNVSFIWKFLC
jgi:myosin-18